RRVLFCGSADRVLISVALVVPALAVHVFLLFFHGAAVPDPYTLSLHDALPILTEERFHSTRSTPPWVAPCAQSSPSISARYSTRSEEHTSELQSREKLVCRLLLEKKYEDETRHSSPLTLWPRPATTSTRRTACH